MSADIYNDVRLYNKSNILILGWNKFLTQICLNDMLNIAPVDKELQTNDYMVGGKSVFANCLQKYVNYILPE